MKSVLIFLTFSLSISNVPGATLFDDVPTAAFSANTVCQGLPTIFTNNSSTLAGTIVASLWDFGDGNGSSVFSPEHTYTNPGNYPVKLTVINSQGDVDDVTVLVTVHPAATVNFSFQGGTQCVDNDFAFTNLSGIISGTIDHYNWDFGDGAVSTDIDPSHVYNASGTYQVTLTTTSDLGCQKSSSQSIDIYPKASVAFIAQDRCQGDVVYFSNETQVSTGIIAFQWDFDDGNASADIDPNHGYALPGQYSVHLTATTDRGCVSDLQKPVIIHPVPTASFSATNHCLDTDGTIVNSSTISSGTVSFDWLLGDGTNSTLTEPTLQYAASGNYLISLSVTSDQGCLASASNYVRVYEKPQIDFSVGDVCQNNSVTVVNNSLIGEGPITYGWNFGDGTTSTETSPVHNYPSAGDYVVSVEAKSEHDCLSTSNTSVTISPQPVVQFVTETHCLGANLPLINNSSISNGTSSYEWNFGDGSSSTDDAPVHQFINPGNYSISLTATSDQGCTASVNHDVYVRPVPVVDFSMNNNCEGFTSKFFNNTSVSVGSITYQWDFGDGGLHGDTNPTHQYLSFGTYPVHLTATTGEGCTRDLVKNIIVYPAPLTSFTVSDVCQDVAVEPVNNSTLALGNMSFEWTFGDNTSATAPSPQHHYGFDGDFTISLRATSDQGCSTEASHQVKVHPLPVADFSVNSVCAGASTQVINSSFISGGALSYLWDFGDGQFSTETNPLKVFTTDGNFDISLTARSTFGCEANIIRAVSISPQPVAAFSVPDHCLGTDAIFSNQSTVASGSLNYFWDFGDGSTSTDFAPVIKYSRTGVFQVKLTATTPDNCHADIVEYVNVDPTPIPDFTAAAVCNGEATSFVNTSTVAQGALSCAWDFGDGNHSQIFSPDHTYASHQTYNVNLVVTSSVGSCTASLTKEIIVLQRPQALFAVVDNCVDSLIRFSNQTQYDGNDVSYEWNFGNGATTSETSPSVLYSTPQTYTASLRATAANGCTTSFTRNVFVFPKPRASFFASNVCDKVSVEFNDISSISSGSIFHSWSFGDANESLLPSPSHRYASDGAYTVVLRVTSDKGCQDTDEKIITVYPLPVTDFLAPAVCEGSPTLFINTSSVSSGGIVSSLWDFGDETNSIVKNPSKEFLNYGKYDVTLTSTTDKNCQTTIKKQIEVYEPPVANFSVNDVCFKETVAFINKSTISSGSLRYRWTFGDGNNSVATDPTNLYEQFGVYEPLLLVTSGTGCADSIAKPLVVFAPPEIDAGRDQSVSQGYNVQLQASGGLHYQWEPIDGLDNSSIANPVATPLETTNYRVTGTDQYGCSNADTVTVFVNKEFKLVASNVITPDGNGKNDAWVIENAKTFGDLYVRVYDRWGNLVYEKEAYQNDWRGERGNDLLPDGTYYYYITFGSSDRIYRGAVTIIRNIKP